MQGNSIRIHFDVEIAGQRELLSFVVTRESEFGELTVSASASTLDPDPLNRSTTTFGTPPETDSGVTLRVLRLDSGSLELEILAPTGSHYRLEASADLLNWEGVREIMESEPTMRVIDPAFASSQVRFYRVLVFEP